MLECPVGIAFSCEKVRFKRQFLAQVVSRHGCMFEDLKHLNKVAGYCSNHCNMCFVPRDSGMHACGFSCKDLSKLRNLPDTSARGNILADGFGTSGSTFQDLMSSSYLPKLACG